MGYESRVYIVSEPSIDIRYDGEKPMAEILASFDLCCIENELIETLTGKKSTEAKCNLYEHHGDEEVIIKKDKYGDSLKSTDIIDVYNAIEYGENWRTTALKDFLHAIIVNRDILTRDFESIKVYHFGY